MSAWQRFADSIRASPCVREVPDSEVGASPRYVAFPLEADVSSCPGDVSSGPVAVLRRLSSGLLRSRPIWPSTAGMYAAIYTAAPCVDAPGDPGRAHCRFVMLEPRNERPSQGCWKLGTILSLMDLLPERRSFAGMRRLCVVTFPDPAG